MKTPSHFFNDDDEHELTAFLNVAHHHKSLPQQRQLIERFAKRFRVTPATLKALIEFVASNRFN